MVFHKNAVPSGSKIAAFTINWNNAEDTIRCLLSLKNCEEELEIFLVDNASSDDSLSEISEAFPDINILCSNKNLGFSGGANLAMKEILEGGFEKILSINNDAILSRGALTKLSRALDTDPKIGMISPWIVLPGSSEIWYAGGRYLSWIGMTKHPKKGGQLPEKRVDSPVDTEYVCGCCVLYRSDFLEDVGLFNQKLFMYGEDLEHSLSSLRRGWKICTLPSAIVEHEASSSTGSNSKHFSKFRSYYYARNPILILYSSPNSIRKFTALLSQLVIAMPYSIARMAYEGSLGCIPSYIIGMVHGFLGKDGAVVKMAPEL